MHKQIQLFAAVVDWKLVYSFLHLFPVIIPHCHMRELHEEASRQNLLGHSSQALLPYTSLSN
jgi:hypothetical protein